MTTPTLTPAELAAIITPDQPDEDDYESRPWIACGAPAPRSHGADVRCNREQGHGGWHCHHGKPTLAGGYNNNWWPMEEVPRP